VLASAPADLLAVRLRADRPGSVGVTVGLESPHRGPAQPGTAGPGTGTLTVSGRAPWHVAPHYHDEDPSWAYHPARGLRFSAALRVIAEGGQVSPAGNGIRVAAADAVTVLITAATGYAGYGRPPADDAGLLDDQCRRILDAAAAAPYAELRGRFAS
jgi:alpha-L-fucosidase 2